MSGCGVCFWLSGCVSACVDRLCGSIVCMFHMNLGVCLLVQSFLCFDCSYDGSFGMCRAWVSV